MLPGVPARLESIEISLIRQINALARPTSINLGLGEPNIVPDEQLLEFARRAAVERSWRYTANAGARSLREIAALRYGSEPDRFCVTAGTQEGLFSAIHAWVGNDDEVLVPDPGFLAYPTIVRLAGGIPVPYELAPSNWTVDVGRLESLVTPRTKAIIINSPSNPTASVMDETTLDSIGRLADERDLLVISDEVYRQIYYTEQLPASMLGRARNSIVIDGLSKSHAMTGLRIGWVIARPEVLKPIVVVHQYVATCASAFSQHLADLILRHDEWNDGWLSRVRSQLGAQRSALLESAAANLDIDVVAPAATFYAFLAAGLKDSVSTAKRLATKADVIVIPGVAFGAAGEGCLRVSFAAEAEDVALGIERIARFLRNA